MKSNVPDFMTKKGITLRVLEEKSGVAHTTILRSRDDEKIRSCSLGTLEKIAAALGVRVRDLFDEDDPGTD